MTELDVRATPIEGVLLLAGHHHDDDRGSLTRLYDAAVSESLGWPFTVRAINLTRTRLRGTLKGLHAQRAPGSESKLITCLAGEVFDVGVDLRWGSPTYGTWFATTLRADEPVSVLLPAGVAHAVQSLTDDAVVHYVHSAAYDPALEVGVDALDPELAIAWPLPVSSRSARDAALPALYAITPLLPTGAPPPTAGHP